MRTIILVILVAASPAGFAAAEPAGLPKPDKSATKVLPVKGIGAANSCAAYGADFVKIEGTETCMKIGGNIAIEARGRR